MAGLCCCQHMMQFSLRGYHSYGPSTRMRIHKKKVFRCLYEGLSGISLCNQNKKTVLIQVFLPSKKIQVFCKVFALWHFQSHIKQTLLRLEWKDLIFWRHTTGETRRSRRHHCILIRKSNIASRTHFWGLRFIQVKISRSYHLSLWRNT